MKLQSDGQKRRGARQTGEEEEEENQHQSFRDNGRVDSQKNGSLSQFLMEQQREESQFQSIRFNSALPETLSKKRITMNEKQKLEICPAASNSLPWHVVSPQKNQLL